MELWRTRRREEERSHHRDMILEAGVDREAEAAPILVLTHAPALDRTRPHVPVLEVEHVPDLDRIQEVEVSRLHEERVKRARKEDAPTAENTKNTEKSPQKKRKRRAK